MNFLAPHWMLLFGIILSFLFQASSLQDKAKSLSAKLLQYSVILLGASLSFHTVLGQGSTGIFVTFFSILIVFIFGYLLQKILRVDKEQSILISMGTAICGGSAIGALAPVIRAQTMSITVAIGVVFILNGLAVFIFPPLGEMFSLSQNQFGVWSALAVHDTSAVVATSSLYGQEALEVATMLKLIRALWIIPITLIFSFTMKGTQKGEITIPWFIFGFLGVSLLFTFVDFLAPYKTITAEISKLGFSITLFLIGLTFSYKKIKEVGPRPFIMAVLLWIFVSTLSMLYVKTSIY